MHVAFISFLPLLNAINLTGWENWAYFAALAGVIVNIVFVIALLRQIRQGQRALQEARRSADAAHESVKEAVYTRIDAQAPRVIPILDSPTFGAMMSEKEIIWQSEAEVVMPRDGNKRFMVGVTGILRNEGRGTARITLNGSAEFYENEDDILLVHPIQATFKEYILSPGEEVKFQWADGHTIAEWVDAYENPSPPNPKGACFMEIIVHDSFEEGIIDHIFLEMSGRPFVPKEGDKGRWLLDDKEFVAKAYPIKRAHLRSENHKITPSWLEIYKG